MGFRIQPPEIEVPDQDPFQYDLLERKDTAEILTYLVSSIEGPCVIAVDAAWGAGKTTFLRLWAQHLRNERFSVVAFNAWETDFCDDPFVSLSTELTDKLRDTMSPSLGEEIKRTQDLAKKVVLAVVPGVVSLATQGVVDLNSLREGQDRLSEYRQARDLLKKFKDSLHKMTEAIAKSEKRLPLVVVVDELDRCRPSYAIELLEAAKHLFAVDGIVFVLALNRAELSHSVRSLYGVGFDAEGYLRRFIDLDFRLPASNRATFVDQALDAAQISEFFKRTGDHDARRNEDEATVRSWLRIFLGSPDVSLRSVAKAIKRLGLVFASLPSDQRAFALTAATALIMRTVDPELYDKFLGGKVTDADVVDQIFSRSPELLEFQQRNAGCVFEALIVLSAHEVSGHEHQPIESPLLRRYGQAIQEDAPLAAKQHAKEVLKRFEISDNGTAQLKSGPTYGAYGFMHSVKRLELLSPALAHEMRGATPLGADG